MRVRERWSVAAWEYLSQIGYDVLNETMGGSRQCYDAIVKGQETFDHLVRNGSYDKLRDDFGLCEDSLDLLDPRQRFAVGFATLQIGDFAYNNDVRPSLSWKTYVCSWCIGAVDFTAHSASSFAGASPEG